MSVETRNRTIRTLLQVVAAGGLAALVQAVGNLNHDYLPVLLAINTVLVTWATNYLEDAGVRVPVLPERK